jgi:hypothetical protein
MVKKALAVLALTTGVVLSGAAFAEPSRLDGSWSVQLVADGGLLCGSGTSQTLTVQNGSVRAGGSGVSLSGQVGPRLGLRQAVGLFGLRELGGGDAGVLRALDGTAPGHHRSGELRPSSQPAVSLRQCVRDADPHPVRQAEVRRRPERSR